MMGVGDPGESPYWWFTPVPDMEELDRILEAEREALIEAMRRQEREERARKRREVIAKHQLAIKLGALDAEISGESRENGINQRRMEITIKQFSPSHASFEQFYVQLSTLDDIEEDDIDPETPIDNPDSVADPNPSDPKYIAAQVFDGTQSTQSDDNVAASSPQ